MHTFSHKSVLFLKPMPSGRSKINIPNLRVLLCTSLHKMLVSLLKKRAKTKPAPISGAGVAIVLQAPQEISLCKLCLFPRDVHKFNPDP